MTHQHPMTDPSNLDDAQFKPVDPQSLVPVSHSMHPPRILILYGSMRSSPFYNRLVDVMEELYRVTLLTRDIKDVLVDRYAEKVESHAERSRRVGQPNGV